MYFRMQSIALVHLLQKKAASRVDMLELNSAAGCLMAARTNPGPLRSSALSAIGRNCYTPFCDERAGLMNKKRLLAVDPSMTCTGWALFDLESRELIGVGKIRSLPAGKPLACRLLDLQQKFECVLENVKIGRGDLLICEAPTTMRDPRAALMVEQVRGIAETLARARGAQVPGRINPRSVHFEVLGLNGRQLARDIIKEMAAQAAQRIYNQALLRLGFDPGIRNLRRNQDIVDAVLVGGLALSRIHAAQLAKVSLEESFDEKIFRRRKLAQLLRKRAAAQV